MSYLLDTDIVSTFNKQTLPVKLARWLKKNEADSSSAWFPWRK
jgi:hypothetical protein